ncbi:MAG: hypothetical protein LJE61_07185 [Thiocapsa sp.]|nr:hypothetical protein [Thiocapsa sp.]MCG6984966.1 hypothetical protein [Thiocapsa sp.]
MDRFTRTALIGSGVLLVLLALSLVPWGHWRLSPRIWQLNDVLKQDPVLADYPYDFRAVEFLRGIATLTRPYDAEVPAAIFLTTTDPALSGKPADDPALLAAEERLREHEMRAISLMLAEPDVSSVVWSLDRAWFGRRGIPLPSSHANFRPM